MRTSRPRWILVAVIGLGTTIMRSPPVEAATSIVTVDSKGAPGFDLALVLGAATR